MTQTRKIAGNSEPYYDLNDDWDLVVASFQTQYGIRLSRDLSGMDWREFSYLISGLDSSTPLGKIVSIRGESDPEVLKNFSEHERRIRNEYRRKLATQKTDKEVNTALDQLKLAFMRIAK